MLARMAFENDSQKLGKATLDYVYRVAHFTMKSSNPKRNAITMTSTVEPNADILVALAI